MAVGLAVALEDADPLSPVLVALAWALASPESLLVAVGVAMATDEPPPTLAAGGGGKLLSDGL